MSRTTSVGSLSSISPEFGDEYDNDRRGNLGSTECGAALRFLCLCTLCLRRLIVNLTSRQLENNIKPTPENSLLKVVHKVHCIQVIVSDRS